MKQFASLLLLPVTVPGAMLGIVYFAITRRHPPTWLLMTFGVAALVDLVLLAMSLLG